jgi:hypothetical protein
MISSERTEKQVKYQTVPDKLRYIVQDADQPQQFDICSKLRRGSILGTPQDQNQSPDFNKSTYFLHNAH